MKLLSTADDFGFSANINRAVIEAYEKGRITELSLMVDSHGTDEAVNNIQKNGVKNVGLHFSLNRLSKDNKTLQGSAYENILNSWSKTRLIKAFDEEVEIFEQNLGFRPVHVIGHKQIALHAKLVEHIANYCVRNNCYARKSVDHPTLNASSIPAGLNIGRTADKILAFHGGSPKEMYKSFKKDIQALKRDENIKSIEIAFHPGYSGEFEKNLTSFIQERIGDINFLLSDYFLRLVEEEKLNLVSSREI